MEVQQLRKLRPRLRQFLKRFDDCFPRKDTRAHLPVYVSGQLSDLPQKSVEPIALNAGVPVRTLQEFLSQHAWDHDKARDRLQQVVRDEHAGPNSVAIFDETSDVKKGDKTPGGYGQELCTAVSQAAGFSLMPSMKTTPFTTSTSSGDPFNGRRPFDADSIRLNTIVRH